MTQDAEKISGIEIGDRGLRFDKEMVSYEELMDLDQEVIRLI